MNCIYMNETSISFMIIFKDENISKNWLSKKLLKKWYISCNNKGWINNVHDIQWLKKCFEPATREKADEEPRLLIYDGHDSHISADFIRHCIANDIVLLLLSSHSSHLLQSLDVDVFSSLKQAMRCLLNRLYRTGITRMQKMEWFECFIQAWVEVVNKSNIEEEWREVDIYPINPFKILDKILKSMTQLTIILFS